MQQNDVVEKILEENLELSCELDEICLELEEQFFIDHDIRSPEKIHLKDSSCFGEREKTESGKWRWCTRRSENEDGLLEPNFDCLTESEVNSTHIVYRNALKRDVLPGEIIIGNDIPRAISMPFGCAWPLNVFVSTSHESEFELHDTVEIVSDVIGEGVYSAKMHLYSDESFSEPLDDIPELGIDDNVFVGVELLTSDTGVNIIVEKAWATPLPTASGSPINIPIVDDRCPSLAFLDSLDVKLYTNGESNLSTFSTGVFKFANFEKAYLHAKVRVCFQDNETCPKKDEEECDSNSRTRRFAQDLPEDGEVVSIGPFYISKEKNNDLENFENGPRVILRHSKNEDFDEFGAPVLIKNGFQLSQTDVLIAALLGVVLMLSVSVITLYCRWRHAVQSRRFQLRKMSLGGALPISVMR
ncbi:Oidioi.mRNA.OKI2018_I69.chr2.g4607.t1.cds [Oikopleura dioica]|uniref:Oidioi.mRNA.OKI2018_I69.chr2.g4607.t1.cds n=1 Tax=Oikopleura dioica TaxID=34765 RepID=A0ABN7T262_OIKDI|nr:Oidioi.mRNA.OKI2018_I69.chr2.g4607.t1.cds [Oikopleura dioica]